MTSKSSVALFCVTFAVGSAIPWVLRDFGGKNEESMPKPAVRSFVEADMNGVTFSVMTQYHQGTGNSMAPECPANFMITKGDLLRTKDRVLSIPYDRLKIWGTRDEEDDSEPTTTCEVSGNKVLELAESRKLQESGELQELTKSFDITKVFENQEDGPETDEVHRLHRSVLKAMGFNRYYYTGKMDYSFREDGNRVQEDTVGIFCGGKKFKKEGARALANPMTDGELRNFFGRGELFLFIDEPNDIDILVKKSATESKSVKLERNVRHMVVTTIDSTCIYKVTADNSNERNADEGTPEEEGSAKVCPARCTCSC